MKSLLDWLDHRTGIRRLTCEALFENIPGGSRWRYVWGSTLTFTIFVQFITGVFLWMGYSASSGDAWESVNYIQNEMTGGWLLRGIHHWTAQFMPVLLLLHLMQVVVDGAYKAPREVNYWFGVLLLLLVLALSLTGYLLPWDQKGFWATKVATNLINLVPFIGPELQQLVIGGTDYGHHTLTRFFALHAGVLPGLLVLLIVGHVYLFRRHGITPAEPVTKRDAYFWPDQVFKDVVACLAVTVAVLAMVLWSHGAHLGSPADPSEPYSAARPDWYFLFLFEFLKLPYFAGENEVWGAIYIPGMAIGLICLMPFIGRWKVGHVFNVGIIFVFLGGAGALTYLAKQEDVAGQNSATYLRGVLGDSRDSHRVTALAKARGIESTALSLLKNDPKTQGARLFAQHCASCHRYGGHDGLAVELAAAESLDALEKRTEKKHRLLSGDAVHPGWLARQSGTQTPWQTVQSILDLKADGSFDVIAGTELPEKQSAPDLKGFATRQWIRDLLDPDQYLSGHYFGGTAHKDGAMYKKFLNRKVRKYDAGEHKMLDAIAVALSAQAKLPSQVAVDEADAALIRQGDQYLTDDIGCIDCHAFGKPDLDADGPDLTGYGSRQWIIDIVKNPEHEKFYPDNNDRMPAFGVKKILTDDEIGLIADWLRGDYFESIR
ncbi:MAG: cytochrome b N-terminal domain-containing protein [Verrucomicrobiota bacterium]|jgi:ubiquinol-cytochrome c reductase cytochrome b subunit|nr:cytochrome b N-terminal domain-containing protein [Verrucomicrobiota bacterium]